MTLPVSTAMPTAAAAAVAPVAVALAVALFIARAAKLLKDAVLGWLTPKQVTPTLAMELVPAAAQLATLLSESSKVTLLTVIDADRERTEIPTAAAMTYVKVEPWTMAVELAMAAVGRSARPVSTANSTIQLL